MGRQTLATIAWACIALFSCPSSDVQANTPMQRYIELERTDYAVAGVGGIGAPLAEEGGAGTVTLAGVSGTVTLALLYWNGLDLAWPAEGFTGGDADYDQPDIRFDGHDISGTRIARFSSNDCWPQPPGPDSTALFRADVTELVRARGDGEYAFSGLASRPGHSANGLSMIVYFDDGNPLNDRHVTHYEGLQSTQSAGGLPFNFALDYNGGAVEAILHMSDGQSSLSDGELRWYAKPDGASSTERSLRYRGYLHDGLLMWAGNSVPVMGHGRGSNGPGLWDIRRMPLTPLYGPSRRYQHRSTYVGGVDCVSLNVAQFVQPSDAQTAALSPNPFDFGDVVVGTQSATQRFTLTNLMPGQITMGALVSNSLFPIIAETCSGQTLAPSATCTADVVYRPLSTSLPVNSEIRLHFTDAAQTSVGPYFFAELRGAGVPEGAFSRVEPQPRTCRFVPTPVGAASAPVRLRMANTGTLPITITSATTVSTPSWFTIVHSDCAGQTVPPGSSCTADISLRPLGTGIASDAFRIRYDADDETAELVSVPLQGPGLAATGDQMLKDGFDPGECVD